MWASVYERRRPVQLYKEVDLCISLGEGSLRRNTELK